MGRQVLAEEGILPNLQALAKPDCYEVGLIIGQTSGQRDYVIHLARTPRPANKDETEDTPDERKRPSDHVVIKSFKDLQEHWIAEHAKHVTRMLPGGFSVMGVFTVGPGDVFADSLGLKQLRQVLVRIKKHLSTNHFLFGDGCSVDKLLLHFDSKTHKHTCRLFSADSTTPSSGTSVDWKFQTAPARWHQIECQYELDQFFPVTEGKVAQPIKKSLQEILLTVEESVQASACIIEGQAPDLCDGIEAVDWTGTGHKAKGKKEPLTLSAVLYQPCKLGTGDEEEMQLLPCGASMEVYGTLASRVFVNEKATVGDAVQALKEDIIRSLAARLELHWDSLIEEEQGSPEERVTLHEPPRRVLVPLPHCRVALSDYLFPGEGPSEALVSLQELLDLDMSEDDVQKDLELQADPEDFCPPEVERESSDVASSAPLSKNRGKASSSQQHQQHTNVLLAGLIVAAVVLILSVTAQLTGWFDRT
ncbi:protein odr-4 homolog [Schistocerca nitens]|uniref:protein odr-4 homolog n=1 Tax=Schistocerca nitens TaxID=7011 RepID=UPI00211953C9|nr:protein odr-4 homolog [Schistocerca nitens]